MSTTTTAYDQLAPFYNLLGAADRAQRNIPRLIEYAQQHDWAGRRVMDVGCGTGVSTRWLAAAGYSVVAVDASSAMLAQARAAVDATRGYSVDWHVHDVRTGVPSVAGTLDMVLAFDVLCDLEGVRELQAFLGAVAAALPSGKWFVAELPTLAGLAAQQSAQPVLLANEHDLVAWEQRDFDHERQTLTVHTRIFSNASKDGSAWSSSVVERARRGFPLHALAAMLNRVGFAEVALLDANSLVPLAPTHDATHAAIFAVKA